MAGLRGSNLSMMFERIYQGHSVLRPGRSSLRGPSPFETVPMQLRFRTMLHDIRARSVAT